MMGIVRMRAPSASAPAAIITTSHMLLRGAASSHSQLLDLPVFRLPMPVFPHQPISLPVLTQSPEARRPSACIVYFPLRTTVALRSVGVPRNADAGASAAAHASCRAMTMHTVLMEL